MASPVLISELQADLTNSDISTEQTVRAMAAHIRAALTDPAVQGIAALIGSPLAAPMGSRREIAGRVWAWLKQNVRFVTDEEQLERLLGRTDELELLISPPVLLRARVRQGDCDDFTMTACALLLALGCPALIKTFKCDRGEPGRWSHVCAAAVLEDGAVFPVDASHGDYAGWEVPARDVYQSQLWDMRGNKVGATMRKRGGLGGYVREPEWTGSEMTTVSGAVAGPYPGQDIMRAYYPGPASPAVRSCGLKQIARGKYGMGDCITDSQGNDYCSPSTASNGIDTSTWSSSLADSYNAALASGAGKTDPVNGVSFTGGTGTAPLVSPTSDPFASFLAQLLPTAAKLTSQALAPGAVQLANGNVLLPSGQIVAGTPTPTAGVSGISGSTILLLGGVLLAVVLVSGKK